ncbi:hypothetical protein JHN63_04770 [Streptomyces sp. MBT65]|uniref:hypothetical protein n=1 Tax=Streptomyces sp. MBT65 TaxID=1488395 RepID=UPI00190A83C9|nr:hypothetical protein [Streptomyces sp. MBT65]MBK3573144.1 hypothetical protein [Streptomyces sp. MBT65]
MGEDLSVGTTPTPDEAAERGKRALARLAARADSGDFDLLLDKEYRRRPHSGASASRPSP